MWERLHAGRAQRLQLAPARRDQLVLAGALFACANLVGALIAHALTSAT
jgi:hypothetical protein